MSLYTYELHLLRESARGSFIDDLQGAGLIRIVADDIEFLGLRCTTSITQLPAGVTAIELAPNISEFERFLAERGDELVRWMWSVMEQVGLLYAFIPGGGDFKYYENGVPTDEVAWTQLPELLETGAVRVVHPLMMFAARVGHARPCDRVKTLNWDLCECRDGIGCLIGLTSPRGERGFDILEPGTTYPQLKKLWA